MRIIICGAGQVGYHIAKRLASEDNEVTLIDQNADLIQKINDQMDVKAVYGHASHPNLLYQVGTETADMLIAVNPF